MVQYFSKSPTVGIENLESGIKPLPVGRGGHPLFNFNQEFVQDMQSVSSIDIAASVPYVSLALVTTSGQKINLNLNLFHNPVDMDNINNRDARYPNRPNASLKSIELRHHAPSLWIFITDIKIDLTIHKFDDVSNALLLALLFPGQPLELEFGWNTPKNDDFLSLKENMLVQVVDYDLNFEISGQAQLSINGKAFNERLNKTYVGDVGNENENRNTGTESADTIASVKSRLDLYTLYLKEVLNQGAARKDTLDNIKKSLASGFHSSEERTRGEIDANFQRFIKSLSDVKTTYDFQSKGSLQNNKAVEVVSFHNVVNKVLKDSLGAISKIIPKVDEFRVIYGSFNDKAGAFKNQSIADFSIEWKKFLNKLSTLRSGGVFVPTVQSLLTIMIDDFIKNNEYFIGQQNDTKRKEEFRQPDVQVFFSNRIEKNKRICELFIGDIRQGVPNTVGGNADFLAVQQNIPTIELGHANSFIKTASLTQISNANMKAVLIRRMNDARIGSTKDEDPESTKLKAAATTPLELPLEGTMSVLGHPEWKPFRTFHLKTGIFILDRILCDQRSFSQVECRRLYDRSQNQAQLNFPLDIRSHMG